MATERNIALIRRHVEELVNQRQLGLIDELFAPDFVDHADNLGGQGDREALRGYLAELFEKIPDLHFKIDRIAAEGDTVEAHTTSEGRAEEPVAGQPVAGKRIQWKEVHTWRISGQQIVEHWGKSPLAMEYWDDVVGWAKVPRS